MTINRQVLGFLSAFLLLSGWKAVALQYRMVDLGTVQGADTEARDINNIGQVAGHAYFVGAAVWNLDGTVQYLGTLPGTWYSHAWGINDSGQVAGGSMAHYMGYENAWLWDTDRGMRPLGSLPGYVYAQPAAINNAGRVAGRAYNPFPYYGDRAFVWSEAGGFVDLSTLPGYELSRALGLNDACQVVGESLNPDGSRHAFLWTAHAGMRDLGTLGSGISSCAYAINNAGQIAGWSDHCAVIWGPNEGIRQVLPQRSSAATDINEFGHVAGFWDSRAFFWSKRTGVVLLPSPVGGYAQAYAINDDDVITGVCHPGSHPWHAVVWVPNLIHLRIDVKPDDPTNTVNLSSNGKLPVAILGASDFDAGTVDASTLLLGDAMVVRKNNSTVMASLEDVNADGWLDLVAHFDVQDLGLTATDARVVLEGDTTTGAAIRSIDSVHIVQSSR